MSYSPFIQHTLAYRFFLWFVHGAPQVVVESRGRLILLRGSWIRMQMGVLALVLSCLWAGCRFHFQLEAVPHAHAVRITETVRFFNMPWQKTDHGLATVVRFHGMTNNSYLELRAPGRQAYLRLMNLREPLLHIEDAARRLLAGRAPGSMELVFPPPPVVPWAGLLLGGLILLMWHPRRATVGDGMLHLHDWGGLWRRQIPAEEISHLGIRDADPAGWRTRLHLPECWMVLAHLHDGGTCCLCVFPDACFARLWTGRAEALLKCGAPLSVPAGTYQVWNSESAL